MGQVAIHVTALLAGDWTDERSALTTDSEKQFSVLANSTGLALIVPGKTLYSIKLLHMVGMGRQAYFWFAFGATH